VQVVTGDGVSLAVHEWAAEGPVRAHLVLGHAMMTGARSLEPLARFLAARGISSWAPDFRGHGASVPPSPRRDAWSFDSYVRQDLPSVWQAVTGRVGPASYLGHSLGGLVGAACFATGRAPLPDRLILVAASPWIARPAGLVHHAVAAAFAVVPRLVGHLPVRLLRLGTSDEPALYSRQLAGWVRRGRWSSLDGEDYGAALAGLRVPTLVVQGDRDPLCRPRDAHDLADRLGGPVRWRRVGVRHGDAVDVNHFGYVRREALAPTLWTELAAYVTTEAA
jgi:predicted alpha/beta hydrolase